MIHGVVAESAGVTLGDLDSLLTGCVYASIADKLDVPMGYLESYINSGSAAAVLADRLGVNMLAAEDLGAHLGREGRIGLIFDLLLGGDFCLVIQPWSPSYRTGKEEMSCRSVPF